MKREKNTIINLICSITVLVINLIMSFWLSPFIIRTIGVEANGFVTLSSNFISYGNLIVTALNSMAARFITIEYVKKNYDKANVYYNSVFWGNLIIVSILLFPIIWIIYNLENIINIPVEIVEDVKLVFAISFINFLVATAVPKWESGTYIKNRLDMIYIPQMITTILRGCLIFSLLNLFVPQIWYTGAVSLLTTAIMILVKRRNARILAPELKVYPRQFKKLCSLKAIKKLIGAGIWNTISSLGIMFLSGLDLVICNLFLNAKMMGVLALAKVIPNYMQQFSTSIVNAFVPELMINYAEGNLNRVLFDIKRSMRITSVLLTMVLAGIFVMCKDFFQLWVPSQDAELLSRLTRITCAGYIFTSGTQVLYNVFSTVNKVKLNAILMVLSGAASTVVVFVLLNTTNLGVYAIAGVSVVINLIRNMFYTVPYTANYLGLKNNTFYPQVFGSVLSTLLLVVIGTIIRGFFIVNTWLQFIIVAGFMGGIFFVINMLLFLNKDERKLILCKIKGKLRWRNE